MSTETNDEVSGRICTRCETWHPASNFHKRSGSGTLRAWCKGCTSAFHKNLYATDPDRRAKQKATAAAHYAANREEHKAVARAWYHANKERDRATKRRNYLRRAYGVTVEWYDATLEAQGGRCAACGGEQKLATRGKTVRLAVDHNHATGQVRGLLCDHCNRAVGHLLDDPERADRLAAYLRTHAPES